MSAMALRERTVEAVREMVDEAAERLATNYTDTLDYMRYTQGRIAGLREALELQAEAYRHIGD